MGPAKTELLSLGSRRWQFWHLAPPCSHRTGCRDQCCAATASAGECFLPCQELTALHSGVCAGAVLTTVSIALHSKQKSTSGFCCWCVTLSESSDCVTWAERCSTRWKGLCESPPGRCCKSGDQCFICHKGLQSWGAGDGLLLLPWLNSSVCVLPNFLN